MTYTEKELDQFLHGISLSLLSKKSAQHWRYDEEIAKEIEWLEVLERKVRADKADRKTENSSEKPNNCETCKWGEWYRKGYDITMMDDECGGCCSWNSKWTPKDEPTISKMEQVDKDINVRSKDEPKTQMKTQNSNLTFEKADEPRTDMDFEVTYTCSFTDCDNFKNFGFGEKCIECKRKQSEAKHKDEPQTDGYMTAEQTEDYRKMLDKAEHKVYGNIEDEPQTDEWYTYQDEQEYNARHGKE